MMPGKDKITMSSKSVVLNLFGTRDRFHGRRFVHKGGVGWGGRGWMVQAMMRAMGSDRQMQKLQSLC